MQSASKNLTITIDELAPSVRDPGMVKHLGYMGESVALCGKSVNSPMSAPVDRQSRHCGLCMKIAKNLGWKDI